MKNLPSRKEPGMKKLSLKILAAVLFIFLLIVILVPVFVDVNHYKSEISTLVKEQSGLKLEIKGDITLSIITGIKFSVDDVSLYNDKKFSDLYKYIKNFLKEVKK